MPEGISVLHNINRLAQEFQNQLTASNIKFGVARALTELAQGSQAAVQKDLPRFFVVRRSWITQGIRIKGATKATLESAVYSIDSGGRRDFMALQEFGGDKSPASGSHIAIPLQAVKPTPQSIVAQGLKPKNLLQYGPSRGARREAIKNRAMAFKVQSKNRPGVEWIMIKKGGRYVPGWLLVPRTKIKQTHFLRDPAVRWIMQNADQVIRKNLLAVLKSG